MKDTGQLPDFVVVGAAKSGTSTLARYLSRHPEIYMPGREVHFFDKRGAGNWAEYEVEWYRSQFADSTPEQVVGEKTPAYSYLPAVPRRMSEVIPDTKLIWMFRDPVDRAYSNYWMAVRNGIEPLSFRETIEYEEELFRQNVWRGYLRRSRYAEQVQRFLQHFDRGSMKFLLFEDFVRDQQGAVASVCEFLGVPPCAPEVDQTAANRGYIPRSRGLTRLIRSFFEAGSSLDRVMLRIDQLINRRREPGYPPMSSDLREQLQERFQPHNRRLEELIGLDVSVWEREGGRSTGSSS